MMKKLIFIILFLPLLGISQSLADLHQLAQQQIVTGDAIEVLNPVAYYNPESIDPAVTTDNATITTWNDVSGNDLHATVSGTVRLNIGTTGRQVEFSGTGYLDVADDPLLDFTMGTDSFTLIWREGDVASAASGYPVSKAASGARQYGPAYGSGNYNNMYAGGNTHSMTSAALGNNRLGIAVFDGTVLNVWIDGVQVVTNGTIGTTQNPGQSVNIGARTDGSFDMDAGSHLDIVAIVPSAANASQRTAIWNEFQINP